MLDACHMLKLVRNTTAAEKTLKVENGKVEWHYFEKLEKYRVDRNLVTHRLTKKHIQFDCKKMCVRLAAQLFSNSVRTTY